MGNLSSFFETILILKSLVFVRTLNTKFGIPVPGYDNSKFVVFNRPETGTTGLPSVSSLIPAGQEKLVDMALK
jgi:hypothetical protein